jgi:hypothetical protein
MPANAGFGLVGRIRKCAALDQEAADLIAELLRRWE